MTENQTTLDNQTIMSVKDSIKILKEKNVNEHTFEDEYKKTLGQLSTLVTNDARDFDRTETIKNDYNEEEAELLKLGCPFDTKEQEMIGRLKEVITIQDSLLQNKALEVDLILQILVKANQIIGSLKGMHISSELTTKFSELMETMFKRDQQKEQSLREGQQKEMTSYIDRTFEFIKTQQNAFLERINITDEMLETMSEHVGLSTKEMADLKEKIEKSKYKEKVYACYCGAQYENLEELQDHQLVHKQEQQERSDTQKRISVKIKTKEELIMGVVDAIASKREKSRYLINRTDWSDEKISEQIGTPSHTIASVRKEVEKLNEEKVGQRTKIVEVPDVVEEQKDNNLDYEI